MVEVGMVRLDGSGGWGTESAPGPHIIVFGSSKSTNAPHCPDQEKSGARAFINGNRSCKIIASRTHPRCGVQRSMLVRPTIGRYKHRYFRINEPQEFPRRQFDHGVVFGIRRPDFSTAAGNSALIAGTKSSPRVAAPVPALPTTRKNTRKNNSGISAYDGWLTREVTPCHGRRFRDGNS
jgi:hypothetical protein